MTELNGETPETDLEDMPFRTVLELWTAVMEPLTEEWGRTITMHWATRIVTTYPEMRFADVPEFRDRFFAKADVLATILKEQIAGDDECLKRVSAEEDAMFNGRLYRSILTAWQKEFILWEMKWRVEDDAAALEMAAIAEIHKMFFGTGGLIGLLDSINLEFTDDDRDTLAAELQEIKEAYDGVL